MVVERLSHEQALVERTLVRLQQEREMMSTELEAATLERDSLLAVLREVMTRRRQLATAGGAGVPGSPAAAAAAVGSGALAASMARLRDMEVVGVGPLLPPASLPASAPPTPALTGLGAAEMPAASALEPSVSHHAPLPASVDASPALSATRGGDEAALTSGAIVLPGPASS